MKEVVNESVKLSLEDRVKKVLKGGKYNLKQFATHKTVCKALLELSTKNSNYPICYLVYFAIGKNAHRINVFESGYKKIDVQKAETILEWLDLFAKHNNNPKLFKNSDLAHVLCKFYDKVSTETKDFKKVLKTYSKNEKVSNFKSLALALNMD